MDAIRSMSERECEDFVSLGDDEVEPVSYARRMEGYEDETDRPFSRAQQRLLSVGHGAYFPWKCCYHLLANERWEDKHSGEGKGFSDEALEHSALTIEWVRALPFIEMGRVVLFGLEPNEHAPLRCDSEPGQSETVAQCVILAPRQEKRLYLQNRREDPPLVIDTRAFWFNRTLRAAKGHRRSPAQFVVERRDLFSHARERAIAPLAQRDRLRREPRLLVVPRVLQHAALDERRHKTIVSKPLIARCPSRERHQGHR